MNEYFIKGPIFLEFSTHSCAKTNSLLMYTSRYTQYVRQTRPLPMNTTHSENADTKVQGMTKNSVCSYRKACIYMSQYSVALFLRLLRFDNIPLNTARHVTSCTRSASIVRFVVFAQVDLYFWKVSFFRVDCSRRELAYLEIAGNLSLARLIFLHFSWISLGIRARGEWSKMHLG